MIHANVSLLHLCQRCPRLAAYSHGGETRAWRVGLTGSGAMPGSLFHDRIAAPFFTAMANGKGNAIFDQAARAFKGRPVDLEEGLHAVLDAHLFLPLVMAEGEGMPAARIEALALGVARFARFLGGFLAAQRKVKRSAAWLHDCFHRPEGRLSATVSLPDGQTLEVSGQYDALLFDPREGNAVVVEFKGLSGGNADADFSQLALYAWLIRQATGVSPRGVVLYLEEETSERAFTAAALEGMAGDNFPPLFAVMAEVLGCDRGSGGVLPPPPLRELCASCPFDGTCDADWGSRQGTPPGRGEQGEPPGDGEEMLARLVAALRGLKVPVEGVGVMTGPRFFRLQVLPDLTKGATVAKVRSQTENLQVALHLDNPPLVQVVAGHVGVDVPRVRPRTLFLADLMTEGRPDSPVAFPLGMDVAGKVYWADLADPIMTNVLVGGATGSGKTVFLQGAVVSLARFATPADVRLILMDPKRVSFKALEGLPHLLCPPILEAEGALLRLESMVEEMEARYQQLEETGVEDITAYRKSGGAMAHHVVFIDEYADLMTDKKTRERLEGAIQRVGQKGRAAGLHLVLATQQPSVKVITSAVKANLQLKIALKVTNESNSRIILDEGGAERLLGHGDMLVGGPWSVRRLQGALITSDDIAAAGG